MSSLQGLWIGLTDRDEFRPIREWLAASAPDCAFGYAETLHDVPLAFATTAVLDFVVICESWPDEFTANDVTLLLTLAPLARTICITGMWSEAVGRTRSHWPPAWRVPLWDAIPRLGRELAALRACRTATPGIAMDFPPATASRQETWLWQSSLSSSSQRHGTVSLKEIADPAFAAWLAESLATAGYTVVDIAANIVLLDVEPWSPFMAEKTRDALVRHPRSVPVAITGWSTPELRSELAALGIEHLAHKLSWLSYLQHDLRICMNPRPTEELAP